MKKLGITTLSQIATLPIKDRTFCVESEFNSRSDGLNPMLKAYGLIRGKATDGRINKLKLAGIFNKISPKITEATPRKLNLRVDDGGEEPANVAYDFMIKNGFVRAPHWHQRPSMARGRLRRCACFHRLDTVRFGLFIPQGWRSRGDRRPDARSERAETAMP